MEEIVGADDDWESVMSDGSEDDQAVDYVNYMGLPLAPGEVAWPDEYQLQPDDKVLLFQVDDVPYDTPLETVAKQWLETLQTDRVLPQEIQLDPSSAAGGESPKSRKRSAAAATNIKNSSKLKCYHEDPNYRYKMPRVKAKVEGRGNGVKTNIMNMGDIARALKRAPEYATKFCGCELGASSKFESAEGKAIVNGIHPEADVQIVIDKFIERFVLCPKCRLPEVDLAVVSGRVQGICNACGFTGDMDNSHKVATFIVKNPPAPRDSTVGKKTPSTGSKKEEKRVKEGKEKETKDKEGKEKKEKKEKKDKEKKKHHRHHHHHERQLLGYNSEEIENVIERLVSFLKKGEKPTSKDFFQEVRLLQVAQDFNGALRVYCALNALHIAEQGDRQAELTPALLQKYAPYLSATCDRSIDGFMILEALEQYVQRFQSACWASYAVLLSTLYQSDILDEEFVIKRYAECPKQEETEDAEVALAQSALMNAYKAAAPFVQWLKEAESASASSDDNDVADSDQEEDEEESASVVSNTDAD